MASKRCKGCGKLTIRISWSGLRVHDECKQKSYLARTKKLALLGDKRNFLAGSVTDRAVRNWLNDDPYNNPGVMPDMIDSLIDSEKSELAENDAGVVRWRDPGDRARVVADCREAVTKIEADLEKFVLPFEFQPDFHFEAPVHVLHPVTKEPEVVILNGYMDLLVRDNSGRYAVWDVKHTRDDSYWRKTVGQLGFYDLAVELMFGSPTVMTGLLQPLCKEPVKRYKPSADSRAQLMQRIISMAEDILKGEKTPKTSNSGCGYCETSHACSKFLPVFDVKGKKRVKL